MHENIFRIYRARVVEFLKNSALDPYRNYVPLTAEYSKTTQPVSYQNRLALEYVPAEEGMVWGREWESAWFHLSVEVPAEFENLELCLLIHTGGESLLYTGDGMPVCGLTGFSVFDASFYKDRYEIGPHAAGETLEFWLEAAANGLFGIALPSPHELRPAAPLGEFHPKIERLRLCAFDRELWSFRLDVRCLSEMLESFGGDDYRGRQLLHLLNRALDIYNYTPENAGAARDFLAKNAFSRPASSSALTACTIGHAHIDVGWLWPVRESIRKAARTFASQLTLMDRYPDYKFGASQAVLYQMMKEHYPVLYEKIRRRVREGRWEIQGGMWVEADCNIISGESMVRQFLYAKNFFRDEFGVNVDNLWLPDVFGYSAALPQIMRKAGCRYFLTQKISWNQINKFPHNTFRWIGVDNSEVLTHFPPEDSYNAEGFPKQRMKAQNAFREGGYLKQFMSLCGIGDGGGGPSAEYIEGNLRMKDLEGCPKAEFKFAADFFQELETHRQELPVWNGELYLEMHRGTFTTQSRTKRYNRKCEQALTALEIFASALPVEDYPADELGKAWKTLLTNQFHDIIPGSSIRLVYETAEAEYAAILAMTEQQMSNAACKLFSPDAGSAVIVNTLSCEWQGCLELPPGWDACAVAGPGGEELPVQTENGRTVLLAAIPGISCFPIRKLAKHAALSRKSRELILENELIRYEFDSSGRLIRAFDKEYGCEILSGPGNVLSLYQDRPLTYEAWDIEIYYKRDFKEVLPCVSVGERISGPVRSSIEFRFATADSRITQNVVLRAGSRRLDFITHADWHENRMMLRAEFPVRMIADQASFDIQYASVKRSTGENTSWDEAMFETCGQRYADLSTPEYGAALLNDCKYGYRVKGSTLDLALLRSPKHPDFFADMGEHDFTYSFFPHPGDLNRGQVVSEAANLNRFPWLADGFASEKMEPMFCRLETSCGVSLEVLKKAEKESSRIVRLVETRGMHSRAVLRLRSAAAKIEETDLIEWKHGIELPVTDGRINLELAPFEIRTLRISDNISGEDV